MTLSRDITIKIKYLIDEFVPPVIRDTKWFIAIPFVMLFKKKAWIFYQFKKDALSMDEEEFTERYKQIADVSLQRETDLNKGCIKEINKNISGKTVLEVGCGRGFLADLMSKKHQVTAADIVIEKKLIKKYPNVMFKKANIEKLPFKTNQFDTVVCTHTLEHVQNLFEAISELRRVAKKRLIIVVPKQRPYNYTFDPHLHFFPYTHSLLVIMGTNKKNYCKDIDGDLFYLEDKI
jgi:ubiquinone/menaquinone biosynthesis C-methylase UbiE